MRSHVGAVTGQGRSGTIAECCHGASARRGQHGRHQPGFVGPSSHEAPVSVGDDPVLSVPEGGSVNWLQRDRPRPPTRRFGRSTSVALVVVALAACSNSDDDGSTASVPSTTQDPVAAAEARVSAAQSSLTTANDALTAASQQFCAYAKAGTVERAVADDDDDRPRDDDRPGAASRG
jgi:hypothetical protein